jgi:hypothetical protein
MFQFSVPCVMFAGAILVAGPVLADERLPTIAPEQYTADQKKAAEEFLAARKVPVFGPFEPMMHSPDIMGMARSMGDYLRYHSAIGNTQPGRDQQSPQCCQNQKQAGTCARIAELSGRGVPSRWQRSISSRILASIFSSGT